MHIGNKYIWVSVYSNHDGWLSDCREHGDVGIDIGINPFRMLETFRWLFRISQYDDEQWTWRQENYPGIRRHETVDQFVGRIRRARLTGR